MCAVFSMSCLGNYLKREWKFSLFFFFWCAIKSVEHWCVQWYTLRYRPCEVTKSPDAALLPVGLLKYSSPLNRHCSLQLLINCISSHRQRLVNTAEAMADKAWERLNKASDSRGGDGSVGFDCSTGRQTEASLNVGVLIFQRYFGFPRSLVE